MVTELREAAVADGADIYGMLQEMPADENGFQNGAHGKTPEEFAGWLKKREEIARGEGLESWMVPENTYWFYAGSRPVGYGKVRHRLTEALRKAGGHIGYAIRPTDRGKGYGIVILKLLLAKARGLGLEKVMIDCLAGNLPSRKVIEANGGVLEKEQNNRAYYWVEL